MALPTFVVKAKNAVSKGKEALKKSREKSAGEEVTGTITGMVKGAALSILSTLALPIIIIVAVIIFVFVVWIIITAIPFIVFGVDLGGGGSGTSGNNGAGGNISSSISYIQWAIDIANDDSHGYSNCNRYGPDYDCSSLVYYSLINSGYSTEQLGSTPFYTYTMNDYLIAAGFERHSYNPNELQAGDILLRDGHTAMYIGNNQIVHATHNEKGVLCGGAEGDQTGSEIMVQDGLGGNWNYYYRLS